MIIENIHLGIDDSVAPAAVNLFTHILILWKVMINVIEK